MVFSTKFFTNSSCRLKIPPIFLKFLSEDKKKKKKGHRPTSFMKSDVSPHKLRQKIALAREF